MKPVISRFSLALLLPLVGCNTPDPVEPERLEVVAPTEDADPALVVEPSTVLPPVEPDDGVLAITDRATLDALPGEAWLARWLGGDGASSTAVLAQAQGMQAIRAAVDADLAVLRADLGRDLVVVLEDAKKYPAGNVGRIFDPNWLATGDASFELAGVVLRPDEASVFGGCGQVRALYRLGYRITRDGTTVSSQLPFTLNVVLDAPDRDCAVWARQWTLRDPGAVAGLVQQGAPRQVELNAQLVRFPSGLETEFAGQAVYSLRVFRRTDGQWQPGPLDNTPDVDRIASDPALMDRLRRWIVAERAAIDAGTYRLPESLAATRAFSWSTLGMNRFANKPFDALFDAEARTGLWDGTAGTVVRSDSGLIERLNEGSCQGCHQNRSTAGFHFLGPMDPDVDGVTNRLAFAGSGHFRADQQRRRQVWTAMANGEPLPTGRPHGVFPAGTDRPAGVNQPCTLGDALAPVACDAGLRCEQVVQDARIGVHIGQCVPDRPTGPGQLCRTAVIGGDRSHREARAVRDKVTQTQRYALPEDKSFTEDSYNCRPTRIGVPLGRTYRRCTKEERSLTTVLDGEDVAPGICAVVGGSKFDKCVEEDFHSCLAGIVARGMVDTCHPGRACREDYICQAFPAELPGMPPAAGALVKADVGFCTPTYFLFQLRLDGHPVPTAVASQ